MHYDGFALDENNRAIICPRCGNEELPDKGRFCPICGVYLINRCTSTDSCGALAAGDARYCIFCGNETTFFQDKLLSSWDEPEAEPGVEVWLDDDGVPF